ncbi:phosphotransferase [Agromyces mediolanus]|uniref:phosphotransferase n=1 Tax=Agromyces mediolanus TaxID=41986 RepID=UPI001E53A49A|nr:phosphotransferase [Agromyces mediolanus]MCD1571875.1 phosphotransferase [Agromyces mediolanus]
MARPPLTLAALATAAVPGLEVRAVRVHTRNSGGSYDAVRLRSSDDRELLIRVPRDQTAETEQSADLLALHALSDGVRAMLPFELAEYVGQAPVDGTRGVVTTFVPGLGRTADELTGSDPIAESVGLAIAAVHNLPTGFIGEAGLPRRTPGEVRDEVVALVGRATDTGHLPAALLRRWEEATDDESLWRFQPTVVNGQLSADSFLVLEDTVTGIVGWSELGQGDPAVDLHWLLTARGGSAERALETYLLAREGGADPHIPQRALLYGELELARWLLHGVEQRDDATIADAVGMLDALVESVHDRSSEPLSPETGPILTVGDVERMLDRTPQLDAQREPAGAMLTDSYDFTALRRREADAEPDASMTAPIPLDLSDWGDAAPESKADPDADPAHASESTDDGGASRDADPAQRGSTAADAADGAESSFTDSAERSADDQARRNSASS